MKVKILKPLLIMALTKGAVLVGWHMWKELEKKWEKEAEDAKEKYRYEHQDDLSDTKEEAQEKKEMAKEVEENEDEDVLQNEALKQVNYWLYEKNKETNKTHKRMKLILDKDPILNKDKIEKSYCFNNENEYLITGIYLTNLKRKGYVLDTKKYAYIVKRM